ncbi:hypothetical protein [Hufsiella ginkgonis]|uniref:Uncharacterized protein n=1 Tax=Hufsiella ginkgonis TaxID=2695274 RepID=A0A7K1Y1F3_9SPHI|nr:hypothetical protein [Hufsiella ginkgonis]MXV16908.1 hypothetical protein [Hufsiella ginkgonis]
MAIFKDSGENAEIFQQRDYVLNEVGIQRYEEEFGKDRATGYMEAMRDFNHQLKHILGAGYLYTGPPKAGMRMRIRIATLFHENDDLIDLFVTKNRSDNSPKF